MQSVVFAWLVTLVLREPAEKVGFAQMALLLPGLFFMLYAGAIADRVGAARQAFWAQLLAACTPVLLIYSILVFHINGLENLKYLLVLIILPKIRFLQFFHKIQISAECMVITQRAPETLPPQGLSGAAR